jgi:hypothetical protein
VLVDEFVQTSVLVLRRHARLWYTDFRTNVLRDGLDEFVDGLIKGDDRLAVDIDNAETFALGLAELDDLLCDCPDDE